MELTLADDPLTREQRRKDFAKLLLFHRVRTRIISNLTGVTRNQLAAVRKQLNIPEDARRRGSSPHSLHIFLSSPHARTEAAAVASLCRLYGGLDKPPRPLFERGQRICEAYEAYRASQPHTAMELEDVFLLMRALTEGTAIQLSKCKECRCAILVTNYELGPRICMHCESADGS